jgi:uncharacterized protein with beta-barrel porin domain
MMGLRNDDQEQGHIRIVGSSAHSILVESSGTAAYAEGDMEIHVAEECDIDRSRTNPVVALGDNKTARGVEVDDTEL